MSSNSQSRLIFLKPEAMNKDKIAALMEFVRTYHQFIRYEDPQASGSVTSVYNDVLLLSDLTALINEHYYPTEFTSYCIKNVDYCRDMGNEWYQIMRSGVLVLKTLDEVYNYWKENEK